MNNNVDNMGETPASSPQVQSAVGRVPRRETPASSP